MTCEPHAIHTTDAHIESYAGKSESLARDIL